MRRELESSTSRRRGRPGGFLPELKRGASVAEVKRVKWVATHSCYQQNAVSLEASGFLSFAEPKRRGWQERTLELYEEYHSSLIRYLSSLGVPSGDVEDIVQEIFLRLSSHLRDCAENDNLRSWIYQVAYNLSMDIHRLQSKDDHVIPLPVAEQHGEPEQGCTPEEIYLQKEKLKYVVAGMSKLTPRQRNCILLRIEGLRYWEIASVLKISEQRAISLVKRGLVQIMKGW